MPKERVLITVKTYPTISGKYVELSCTAGFREDGSWIRLYPIPFRLLEESRRYGKYQWVEAEIAKNKSDPRPESYRVTDIDNIKLLEKLDTSRNWEQRRKIVEDGAKNYTSLKTVIDLAHENKISLAVFKPSEIIDFTVEDAEPEWPKDKIESVLNALKQKGLFEGQNPDDFKVMPKLPKKFSYIFKDDSGRKSRLMIEDWEIGQLYLNCLKSGDTPEEADKKVRLKYFDDFAFKKDLRLFLGTTRKWHFQEVSNPYVIIGTFHPPLARQPSLL